MTSIPLAKHLPNVSNLAFGCMGLGGGWSPNPINKDDISQANLAIDAAFDAGINFFDHADIYTLGKAEQVFGEVLKQRSELRSQMYLQSKCTIRLQDDANPGRYDHSKQWVESSVNKILKRLHIEKLDVLLLHRPDPLMDVEELAETLNQLKSSGKVDHFGVSNMHRYQMELINKHLSQPLIVNQLEMSLQKHGFLDQGVTVAMDEQANVGFDTGILEYCQLNDVQLQSWGSLSQGLFSGRDVSAEPEQVKKTAALVTQLAHQYNVSKEAVVLGWLMRLPYKIQPVIGTVNPERIAACGQAGEFSSSVTREDWYKLYVSARGNPLP